MDVDLADTGGIALYDAQVYETEKAVQKFQYLDKYEVIVCRSHGYAVLSLRLHISKKHSYSSAIEKSVLAHFSSCKLRYGKHVTVPEPDGLPFDCLAPPKAGFLCEASACGHVSTDLISIITHCNTVHNWNAV